MTFNKDLISCGLDWIWTPSSVFSTVADAPNPAVSDDVLRAN